MSGVMTRILAVVSIIISFVFMSFLYGYNEQGNWETGQLSVV